jgi:uncharacterized protein (DUF1810 family)
MPQLPFMADPFNLQRFVIAQAPMIDIVRDELTAGAKRTHWMWYIFPQIAGLGASAMSQTYAISGRAEAQAYINHLILGTHLLDCTNLVLSHRDHTAAQIFGSIDAAKFRSCMTLFAYVCEDKCCDGHVFTQALARFFDGIPDPATLERLHSCKG